MKIKKFYKNLILYFICLLFLLLTATQAGTASAMNNYILVFDDGEVDFEAREINGVICLPFEFFEEYLGLSMSYFHPNLFIADKTESRHIIFDIDTGRCRLNVYYYCDEAAYYIDSTFYLPADFVSTQFGYVYSYIEGSTPVIRVKSGTAMLPDSYFKIEEVPTEPPLATSPSDAAPQTQPDKPIETVPVTPTEPPAETAPPAETKPDPPPPEPEIKDLYITININDISSVETYVQILEEFNYKALFFISIDAMRSDPSKLRLIEIMGHTTGVLSYSLSIKGFFDDMFAANSLLKDSTRYSTRILRVKDGIKNLSHSNYNSLVNDFFVWDWTLRLNDYSRVKDALGVLSSRETIQVLSVDDEPGADELFRDFLNGLESTYYKPKLIGKATKFFL